MKRDLLTTIEEGMPFYSKSQKRIAAYILEHYETAAYLTASKLSRQVGVSESTIVRFAVGLKFEGYPELLDALRKTVRNRLTAYRRMEVTNHLFGDRDVLSTIFASDASKIHKTANRIDREAFHTAVDKIIEAKHLYIIGMRSSATLANALYFNLRVMSDQVRLLSTTERSELYEQMLQIGEGDSIIAMSFPRYAKRIVDVVDFAKSRGANVIALTDSPNSPIAPFADQLILAESDMFSFVDSLVSPLSVINALLVSVAQRKHEELAERFALLEQIWEEQDVYDNFEEEEEEESQIVYVEVPAERKRGSRRKNEPVSKTIFEEEDDPLMFDDDEELPGKLDPIEDDEEEDLAEK